MSEEKVQRLLNLSCFSASDSEQETSENGFSSTDGRKIFSKHLYTMRLCIFFIKKMR